jgi:CheY-like chemotaxis protein
MNQTILVVDDIAANRNLLSETLETKGYEVLLASNGVSALKVADRAKPNLILLDVNMPDMDGYDACRQLKKIQELAEIPVIFITANDDPESLVKGFQAGAVDYIAKPFKQEEVLMRVETHLKIHTLTRALETATRSWPSRTTNSTPKCGGARKRRRKPTKPTKPKAGFFRSSATRCGLPSMPSSASARS